MGAYNDRHPRGNKLKIEEIKARREQIYEKYTREYVAPVRPEISQFVNPLYPAQGGRRKFPDVSVCMANLSDYLPKRQVNGHFEIANQRLRELRPNDRFEIRLQITQEDTLGRSHEWLPEGFVYRLRDGRTQDCWYAEP